MKKSGLLILVIVGIMLVGGCGTMDKVSDDFLSGKWTATSGFEEEEVEGDPICPYYDEGLEFLKEETVYANAFEEEITYRLNDGKNGMYIELFQPNGTYDSYMIYKVNEDAFGLIGKGIQEKENCYFEREK